MNSTPQHHPDKNLLIEFATGTIPYAQSIAIKTHLHYCAKCRHEVKALEQLGGALLESAATIQTPAKTDLDSIFEQIMSRLDTQQTDQHTEEAPPLVPFKYQALPKVIQKMLSDQAPRWRRVTNSLKTAALTAGQDQYAVSLQKIQACGQVPEHDHRGSEMTVVLKGSFSDEDHVYQQGDFLLKEPGDVHRPVASSNEDCLCLSVEQAPVKLTGLLGTFINPFLRINPA